MNRLKHLRTRSREAWRITVIDVRQSETLEAVLSREWVLRLACTPARGALLWPADGDIAREVKRIAEAADFVATWPHMKSLMLYDSAMRQIETICNE